MIDFVLARKIILRYIFRLYKPTTCFYLLYVLSSQTDFGKLRNNSRVVRKSSMLAHPLACITYCDVPLLKNSRIVRYVHGQSTQDNTFNIKVNYSKMSKYLCNYVQLMSKFIDLQNSQIRIKNTII